MYKINKLQHGKGFFTGFSHSLVKYQKSHSFAAITRSISDTSPTRVKIPCARAFHEVISLSILLLTFTTECGRKSHRLEASCEKCEANKL